MGVLRVDHPDVIDFIQAKHNSDKLTAFNVSLGVTDQFMQAVLEDKAYPLTFNGRVYNWVKARQLWDTIMRSTWFWAEPGVVFIDTINKFNNLWYCETISATNPCGEQPLPPYGACLLGSFNLTQYIGEGDDLDYDLLFKDVDLVVPAMDHVIDVTTYPLDDQAIEARMKRRMGLGVTGVADALEALGCPYGSPEFIRKLRTVLMLLMVRVYRRSAELARERGPFPLYDNRFLNGKFIRRLPPEICTLIAEHGIRNSHLLSIAPTGTISMCADNVSSGIEPPYAHVVDRVIQTEAGPVVERIEDYAVRTWGIRPKTATEVPARDHVAVLCAAQEYVDSAVSKTINVDPKTPWNDFKDLYFQAWEGGAKGCTTFNPAGKRMGILTEVKETGPACRIDPETGARTCDE